MLVPTAQATSPDAELFRLAAESQLAVHEVTALLMPVEGDIDVDQARRAHALSGAIAVAWLTPWQDRLFLYIPALDEQPRQRPLPPPSEGWTAVSQAAATMKASELQPLLVAVDVPPVEVVEPDEIEPEPVPVEPRPPGEGSFAAGYAPTLLSAQGPLLHGLGLRVTWLFEGRVGVHAGLDLCQPADLDPVDGRVVRWPLRIGASAALDLGRGFDLLASLGAVLDVWHVRGLDYTPDDRRATQPNVDGALAWSGAVRYRVLPWLAPYVGLGGVAYFQPLEFQRYGDPVLQRDAVNLGFELGVAVLTGRR